MGCKFDDFETGLIDDILDFQPGGSSDERQYVTYVKVSDEGIEVTAYQRTEAGDASKKNCQEYTAIDQLVLEKKSDLTIVFVCAGILVFAGAVLAVIKKKKKA